MSKEIENGLDFKLNPKNKKLYAVISPCNDKIELSAQIIKDRLEQRNLNCLLINDNLVFELAHEYNRSTHESFEFEIGEQRDATCEIRLSDDKMKAYLTLTPNFGGNAITIFDVRKQLLEKDILYGMVSEEEIEAVLQQGEVQDFVIAQGIETVEGVDTQFVSLISGVDQKKSQPLVREDGSVDFREMSNTISVVNAGEVLMVRTPPVEGKAGRNVLGEIVQPSGGADLPFSNDRKGVCLNPENENQIISTITGQPVLVPNGIIVLPVLTVKRVDLASGNIHFNGSVVVNGDVKEGMSVYAVEDITIEGNVFNSKIECLGNLTIKGSVTGNSELLSHGNVVVKGGIQGYGKAEKGKEGKIITRGSAIIGFVENFIVEAAIDIVIEQYSMNNTLMAQNKIVIGHKCKSNKSSIIGGITWAMNSVTANVIGTSANLKTRTQVGSNPYIQKRILEIKTSLSANEKSQRDIQTVLSFIENHPEKGNDGVLEKLHRTLSKLILEKEGHENELKELIANMSVIDTAKVVVTQYVYSGSEIQINNVLWKAQENRGKSVFRVAKREMNITLR